jgi:hypothetical protein
MGGRPKLVTDDISKDIQVGKAASDSFRSIAKRVCFSVVTVQNMPKSAVKAV